MKIVRPRSSVLILLLTYVSLAAIVFVFVGFVNDFLLDIRSRVQGIAEMAAREIDGDAHEKLQEPDQEGSELYKSIQAHLQDVVKNNIEVQSVYTLRKTDTPNLLKFVVDSQETEDSDENGIIDPEEEKAHLGEEYESSEFPELAVGFSRPSADQEVTCDKWGCWVSGYAPIINSAGEKVALLGVDVSADYFITVRSKIQEKMTWAFVIAVILSLLFGGIGIALAKKERKKVVADRDLLSSIIETSPVGIYTINKKGQVETVNSSMLKLLNLSDEKSFLETNVFETEQYKKPGLESFFREGLKGKSFETDSTFFSLDRNKQREVRCWGAPIFDQEHKQVLMLLVLVEDVTEKKKAVEKLLELDELRNKFIRTVSHQLRTPLNIIRWNLESLLAGELGVLKKEQKEFMGSTYDANVGVIRLINDMLTAMDIEEGRMTLNRSKISPDSLIQISELEKQCSLKGVKFSYQPTKQKMPLINIDPEKIKEVFDKLIQNAISYTRKNGKINVSFTQSGTTLRFEIKDNGVGISKADQRSVFSRFFRASNAALEQANGSGLGLFVCKHIVQAHGGTIGFKSVLGKGSTFWVELPV